MRNFFHGFRSYQIVSENIDSSGRRNAAFNLSRYILWSIYDMCTDGDPVPDSYSFVEVPASAAAHGEREKIAPNASASVKINGCTVNISDSASVSFLRKLFEAAGNDR